VATTAGTRHPSKPIARSSLSRDTVADRALAVADAEGLDAVTIRRLAAELEVTPMALYWHFRTKEDLLDGAADRVLAALAIPTESTEGWQDEVRNLLGELVRVLGLHPQMARRAAYRLFQVEAGLDLTERALAGLLRAGCSPEEAAQLAGHAMLTAIMLVTNDMVDASGTSDEEHEEKLRRKQVALATLPPDRFPLLSAHAAAMATCASTEAFFALGIDHFVAGVAGLHSMQTG